MPNTRFWFRWFGVGISLATLLLPVTTSAQLKQVEDNICPPPALSQVKRHRVATGETLDDLARQYNLVPTTLIRWNPGINSGTLPTGRELLIPPLNGIRIEVPRGATWKDLEAAYGVRADILFELNGCDRNPGNAAFIPGINWSSGGTTAETYTGLRGYPLPQPATIGLPYGWRESSSNAPRRFHSGLDLLAPVGTPVLAADAGTIAFVGQQGNYGNLVIINHANNQQTRYAHLNQISVQVGQSVNSGTQIGTVGTTGQPDIPEPHVHFEVRFNTPLGWVAQDPAVHLR
jgi:murein DD-endopeptidase MepM/ murein hydrolase activator NlpD